MVKIKYTLIQADAPELPYTIKVMPTKVHSGIRGYWYRFWWKFLLGTEFDPTNSGGSDE